MIDDEFLSMLICPDSKQPLKRLSEGSLKEINARIRAGTLKNASGDPVSESIDAGLHADGGRIYRIREGIPDLVVEESIPFEGE